MAFLCRELDDIGLVANPAKTVALPRKGNAPTTEEVSPPEDRGTAGVEPKHFSLTALLNHRKQLPWYLLSVDSINLSQKKRLVT